MGRAPLIVALLLVVPTSALGQAEAEAAETPAAEAEAPAIPSPPSPVQLRPATVRFGANLDGVHVHYAPDPVLEDDATGGVTLRLLPESRFSELCLAPCDRDLPQTHLALAFSRGGTFARSRSPFGVDGPTRVEIDWFDRSGERLAGGLVLGLGLGAAAIALVSTAAAASASSLDDAALGLGVGTGVLLLGAALAVGLFLLLLDDTASFASTPLPDDAPGVFSEEWN